ncbi:MAG: type III-A CRISPR-associated RAMP protein Csm4 [bacterium]
MLLLARMRFKRAISIGGGDLSLGEGFTGILHSDTIFSGIANKLAEIPSNYDGGYSIKELISNLNTDSPPFRISSAFPYFMDEYYLPTPYGTGELYLEKLKDVPLIKLSDFLELASGNYERIKKKPLKDSVNELMVSFTAPRVTIDRITTSTNIYQTTGWLMNQDCGLYFLIDLKDELLKDKLLLCIRLLGESGIGGDRSIGYGIFDSELIEIDNLPEWSELFQERGGKNTSYYSLSLCYPSNNDEAKEAISYNILSRKGWIFSSSSIKQSKRRECKMFAEGSLFKSPIKGQMAKVAPSRFRQEEHEVYRYGLGMMVEIVNHY